MLFSPYVCVDILSTVWVPEWSVTCLERAKKKTKKKKEEKGQKENEEDIEAAGTYQLKTCIRHTIRTFKIQQLWPCQTTTF